jgi:hypothetical protein
LVEQWKFVGLLWAKIGIIKILSLNKTEEGGSMRDLTN